MDDLKALWKAALRLPEGVEMSVEMSSPGKVNHVLTQISLLLSAINMRLSLYLVLNTT